MMGSVKFIDINKSFGKTSVLKNINLSVDDGEFLVLVGPSGCGKSTSLRLIAGLESPTSGKLYIGNRLVNDMEPAQRDIAMVFQNYALYPHLDIYENMAFGLKIRKFSELEISNRVKAAAEILQINELLHRKPKELSGGQRQRVALGRCIVRQPKVFLFDEPLSNLDAKLRAEMRVEIKKLHQLLKTTMMYVTHDQTEAMTMGDRIAVMNNGIIEQLDTPMNIYSSPINKFVAEFIGTPKINFFEGEIRNENGNSFFLSDGIRLRLKKPVSVKNVVLGVRPENISISVVKNDNSVSNSFKARVELVEPLGANYLVYFKTNNTSFIGSIRKNRNIQEGDILSVDVNMANVHLFHPESGKNLSE